MDAANWNLKLLEGEPTPPNPLGSLTTVATGSERKRSGPLSFLGYGGGRLLSMSLRPSRREARLGREPGLSASLSVRRGAGEFRYNRRYLWIGRPGHMGPGPFCQAALSALLVGMPAHERNLLAACWKFPSIKEQLLRRFELLRAHEKIGDA